MYKFVLDADVTIKLAKAGLLQLLSENAQCVLPTPAYDEVMKGKEKAHTDAIITETLVIKSEITVIDVKIEQLPKLGKGESGVLTLFKQLRCDVIISDDRQFISTLKLQNINFMTSTDTIVWLFKSGKLERLNANTALEKIKYTVSGKAYQTAKKDLEAN